MAIFQKFLDEFFKDIVEDQFPQEMKRLEKDPDYVDGKVEVQIILGIQIVVIDENKEPDAVPGRLYLAGERGFLRAMAERYVKNALSQGDETEVLSEAYDTSMKIDKDTPLLTSPYKPPDLFPGLK